MNPTPAAQDAALATFRDVVVLWHVGQKRAADIVFAACDLLVSGVDGPALRELAGITIGSADVEVHAVLAAVVDELGLVFHPRDSEAAEREALAAMAARVLSSAIAPRHLTSWTHLRYAHDRLELANVLACLDDEYDSVEYTARRVEDIDAEVMAEARSIVTQYQDNPDASGPGEFLGPYKYTNRDELGRDG